MKYPIGSTVVVELYPGEKHLGKIIDIRNTYQEEPVYHIEGEKIYTNIKESSLEKYVILVENESIDNLDIKE